MTQFFINLSLRDSHNFSSWWLYLVSVSFSLSCWFSKTKINLLEFYMNTAFQFWSQWLSKIKMLSVSKVLVNLKMLSKSKQAFCKDGWSSSRFLYVSGVWSYLKSWRCDLEKQNTSGIFRQLLRRLSAGSEKMIELQSPSLVLGIPLPHESLCIWVTNYLRGIDLSFLPPPSSFMYIGA